MTTEYTLGSIRQLTQDPNKYAAAAKAIREAAGKITNYEPEPPMCKTCRYWDSYHAEMGYCKRRAPCCVDKSLTPISPVTSALDWCGEWELNVMKTKEGGE